VGVGPKFCEFLVNATQGGRNRAKTEGGHCPRRGEKPSRVVMQNRRLAQHFHGKYEEISSLAWQRGFALGKRSPLSLNKRNQSSAGGRGRIVKRTSLGATPLIFRRSGMIPKQGSQKMLGRRTKKGGFFADAGKLACAGPGRAKAREGAAGKIEDDFCKLGAFGKADVLHS